MVHTGPLKGLVWNVNRLLLMHCGDRFLSGLPSGLSVKRAKVKGGFQATYRKTQRYKWPHGITLRILSLLMAESRRSRRVRRISPRGRPGHPPLRTKWSVPRLLSQSQALLSQPGRWTWYRCVCDGEVGAGGRRHEAAAAAAAADSSVRFLSWFRASPACCQITVMAQQNLSAVLYSQGDLRLVGERPGVSVASTCQTWTTCKLIAWLLLFFFQISSQESRPIPEPGPNGMTCISLWRVQFQKMLTFARNLTAWWVELPKSWCNKGIKLTFIQAAPWLLRLVFIYFQWVCSSNCCYKCCRSDSAVFSTIIITIIIFGIFKWSWNLYCLAHHLSGLSKVKLFKWKIIST